MANKFSIGVVFNRKREDLSLVEIMLGWLYMKIAFLYDRTLLNMWKMAFENLFYLTYIGNWTKTFSASYTNYTGIEL